MTRPLTPSAIVAFLAAMTGCRSSTVQAGPGSLGIITFIIVGGALFVALFAMLYGKKSDK